MGGGGGLAVDGGGSGTHVQSCRLQYSSLFKNQHEMPPAREVPLTSMKSLSGALQARRHSRHWLAPTLTEP